MPMYSGFYFGIVLCRGLVYEKLPMLRRSQHTLRDNRDYRLRLCGFGLLPVWQDDPIHPGAQSHLSGPIHNPLFWQGLWQMAAERNHGGGGGERERERESHDT